MPTSEPVTEPKPTRQDPLRARLLRFRNRLADLSGRNRSLRLPKLSARWDVDLFHAGWLAGKDDATPLLKRLLAGQDAVLLRELNARIEGTAKLDKQLQRLHREANALEAETGLYELYLAYPFVEGRFADGTVTRAPLLLTPLRLQPFRAGARWRLEPREEGFPRWNRTFLLAYSRFNRQPLSPELAEEGFEDLTDLDDLFVRLHRRIQQTGLQLELSSDFRNQPLTEFRSLTTADLEALPLGNLKIVPHAVLGVFRQADSVLMDDYEMLEAAPEQYPQLVQWLDTASEMPASSTYAQLPMVERCYVLPTDSAQRRVLERFQQGVNQVVQGPPGTGKSQLIVNAISTAIAAGESVLVVSQKRVALDVVYQRLQQVELDKFSFLIHDFRNDRQAVCEQLDHRLSELPQLAHAYKATENAAWQRLRELHSARLDQLWAQDERYVEAFFGVQPCGLSPYELYLQPIAQPEALPRFPQATAWTVGQLEAFLPQARELEPLAPILAPAEPCMKLDTFTGWDAQRQVDHGSALRQRVADAVRLDYLSQTYGRNLDEPNLSDRLVQQVRLLEQALAAPTSVLARFATRRFTLSDMKAYREQLPGKVSQALEMQLPALGSATVDWQTGTVGGLDALITDTEQWLERPYWYHRLFSRAQRLRHQRVKGYTQIWGVKANIAELQKRVAALRDLQTSFQQLAIPADHPYLEVLPTTLNNNSLHPIEALAQYDDPLVMWSAHKWVTDTAFEVQEAEEFNNKIQKCLARTREWQTALGEWQSLWAQMTQTVGTEQTARWQKLLQTTGALQPAVEAVAVNYAQHATQFIRRDNQLAGWTAAARELLPLLRQLWTQGDDWQTRLREVFHHEWLLQAENQYPELARATTALESADQKELETLWKGRLAQDRLWVHRKLQDRVLSSFLLQERRSLNELRHQLQKKRQRWPLRKIIETFWHRGLRELMPCVLCGPETAAALFPLGVVWFDHVIFDEASQCPVERGLPVALRGRTLTAAGDSQQMPPYDLFRTQVGEDTDTDTGTDTKTEAEAVDEVESLLDWASLRLEPGLLTRHYRSRQASLIAFSNQHFYRNQLQVLPDAIAHLAEMPFRYHHVREARMEQGANVVEACAVVARLLAHITQPQPPSIGIIALNYPQQQAIYLALDEQRLKLELGGDEELRMRFVALLNGTWLPGGEPLFIKNLENVQGDERDVILFSVVHAPNQADKLSRNFGLLNQQGGENRLNVAISRARQQMEVFASFLPEQLTVGTSQSKGLRLLAEYLQFVWQAQSGVGHSYSSAESPLQVNAWLAAVERHWSAQGWQAELPPPHTTLGFARVLRKPGSEPVALWLEGSHWYTGRDAAERNYELPHLLAQRGWQVQVARAKTHWQTKT